MSRQLRRRVSEAGQDGHGPDAMPLWAWARTTRHELVRQARWTARHAPGEVLLTLRVPASRVLLSRYDEWHTVLNNSPLWPPDLSVDDLDSFDADWDAAWGADWHKRLAAGPEPALLDALESSWEAVFEVSVGSRRWAIQACLATIRAADVRDVVMIGASHRTGSTEPMLSSD
nr:hypothetical protein GCM10020092_074040 [Actinoplanes digitatis]